MLKKENMKLIKYPDKPSPFCQFFQRNAVTMNISQPAWSLLGTVDITAALEWLSRGAASWHKTASDTKPQRAFDLPAPAFAGIIESILRFFPDQVIAHSPMLSRMLTGQSHPMHVDSQRADWITRVHVPLVTNPTAWIMFEEESTRVHFLTGIAYSFDIRQRHAFGNDGPAERVHFIVDVLRKD